MQGNRTIKDPTDIVASLRWPLRLTLAGLWAERLLRVFWPLMSLILLVLAGIAFGLPDLMSAAELRGAAGGALALGLGLALWGVRRFRRPLRGEVLARLDASLPGRPIAALIDTQAIGRGDEASRAVWVAHQARMAARAGQAKPVAPDLRLSSRDPYALRYVAATAFVMSVIFGSLWRVGSGGILTPADAAQMAQGPIWEGWAQPPAYTGKPTVYLTDVTAPSLELPVGTRVQLRLYGEPGEMEVRETVSDPALSLVQTAAPAADSTAQSTGLEGMAGTRSLTIAQSGVLDISGPGGRAWDIIALPDALPTVTVVGEIKREADGRFKQGFAATDDYAVVKGQVTITLDLAAVDRRYGLAIEPEPVAPVVLDLPMPIRGDRTAFDETLVDDLSEHVFSNLPVTLTFAVADAAGQSGEAAPKALVLPGRRFFDPLAAALIEMRRDILWSRQNAARGSQLLKAITFAPEGFIRNEQAFLRLRVAMRDLDAQAAGLTVEQRDALAAELWEIALMVEEGDLANAKERLRRAQDRLDEAIKNGATPEEIDELMREMREALNDYMRELAEEQQRNPNQQMEQGGEQLEMSQDQLQQMLDELQRLMEEGRTAEAAELMEQLRQFMENMQMAEGQGGQGQGGPGQQAMRDLQDTLRDQQDLSDDAFRDLQDGDPGEGQQGQQGQQGEGQEGEGQEGGGQGQGQQEQNGQGDGGQGADGDNGEGQGSLTDRQRSLRERLRDLQGRRLPGDGTEQGEAGRDQLDRADRSMREAEDALRDGDLDGALDRQADAMEALREGMRQFGEAMAQEQREEQGGAREGREFSEADPLGRDPLGREPGDAARIGSDRNMLQGEDIYRRAQELLEELRRRSGDQSRPDAELDYLKRLLDLF